MTSKSDLLLAFLRVVQCIGASDNGDGTYHLDFADGTSREATPAEVRAAALALVEARIKAERDRRELEDGIPVTFPGAQGVWRFHSDTLGGRHLLGLFNVAFRMRVAQLPGSTPMPGEPGTLGFKTMGREERVQLTVERVELLEQAAFAKSGALHAAAVAHIAAAGLLDDPLAYDYSTGWPE